LWQDALYFFKFVNLNIFKIILKYQIFNEETDLFTFMQYYDVEGSKFKQFKNTVTIENGLKFPEFMVLLLKAISYL